MEQKVLLQGWLAPLKDQQMFSKDDYDINYEPTSSYEEVENIDVIGFYENLNSEGVPFFKLLDDKLKSVLFKSKEYYVNASVIYHITDEEKSWEELTTNMLNQLEGEADSKYQHHFSSLTGYLWTDEEFIVNEHDIGEEIKNILFGEKYYVGYFPSKYILIEVTFSG